MQNHGEQRIGARLGRVRLLRTASGPGVGACLLLGLALAAAADEPPPVAVTPIVHAEGGGTTHGYFLHQFEVENLDRARSRRVTFILGGGEAYRSASCVVRRTVVLAPGALAVVCLPQPPLCVNGANSVGALIDGRGPAVRVDLPYSVGSHLSYVPSPVPRFILVSRSLPRDELQAAFNGQAQPEAASRTPLPLGAMRAAMGGGSPSRSEHRLLRAEAGIQRWPASWLAYTRFDGVVLSARDWEQLPAEVRDGLWSWVEAGGALLVLGTGELAEAQPWGAAEQVEDLALWHVGFGLCAATPKADVAALTEPVLGKVRELWPATQAPWQAVGDSSAGNAAFPVVAKLTMPVGGMYLAVLAFVILAVPVSLLVLARLNRRIWILWTTPALAVATCLVVVVYAYLGEGLTARARLEGVTLLDQDRHRAVTLAQSAFYCPLTPRRGLHFAADTEVTPRRGQLGSGTSRYGRSEDDSVLYLDASADQHLYDGAVTARVPAHFLLRSCRDRRERLEVRTGPGGELTVVNGLGAAISRLCVADATGRIHEGAGIPPGGRAALRASEVEAAGKPSRFQSFYGRGDWAATRLSADRTAAEWLTPGTYLAVLDGCPFVERGLEGRADWRTAAVVFGFGGVEGQTP